MSLWEIALLWLAKKIAADVYDWMKPLVLARLNRRRRYQIMFI